eukprot:gene2541-4952_t
MASSLNTIAYSFMGGIIAYLLFIPFYCSRKSWWDAMAANKVIFILRLLVLIEMLACFLLLYIVIAYGSPLPAPFKSAAMAYGTRDSNSWVYGYARPITGIVTIIMGAFGEMHPAPRFLCIFGAILQAFCDGLSAVGVMDYIDQFINYSAPLGQYNLLLMTIYLYRDLISLAVNVWIILLCSHLANVVGWWEPQLISYQSIVGGDLDRCQVMREQMDIRSMRRQSRSVHRKSSHNNEDGGKYDTFEADGDPELRAPSPRPIDFL